jgi:hypothetical protein
VVIAVLWLLFTWKRDLVEIVQEAGWVLGLVWMGAENYATTRFRTLDCPACGESL